MEVLRAFLACVALTGTRQSVALGLKWKHVALGETLRNHSETASHRGRTTSCFAKRRGRRWARTRFEWTPSSQFWTGWRFRERRARHDFIHSGIRLRVLLTRRPAS